ncbi:MAG TPA: VOC family protein [Pyrinomonadaceae bacterium]|nr:VOC family protein [Pyrinomonadaceae bacterium]
MEDNTAETPTPQDAGVARLFRVTLPVEDIERAADFYARLLGTPGERVWVNRHYFRCGEVILACVAPPGDPAAYRAQSEQRVLYFAVPDLDAVFARAGRAGCRRLDDGIEKQEWGERSFYADDPFGNPLCFVEHATQYTGGAF